MEETAFLTAMQRVVGGVEIEGDLLRRSAMGLKEQIDQQGLDRRRVAADLMVAARLEPAQFEPVQRRLARHRRTVLAPGFQLAGKDRHHRIMAKLIVIDQVLIAERQPKHALADQRLDLVRDQLWVAKVTEAGGKAIDEADRPVGRAKQHRPGVRSDASAVESRHNRTSFNG